MEPTDMGTGGAATAGSSKLILGVIAILAVAGIGYAVMSGGESNTDVATTTDEGSYSGDIFGLLERGGDWTCTWAAEQGGADLDGTVYVSDGKFRAMMRTVVAGQEFTADTIGDGQYMYIWSSMMPTGMKVMMRESEIATDASATPSNAQWDQFTDQYDYSCARWERDNAMFEVPSSVTFTEISSE